VRGRELPRADHEGQYFVEKVIPCIETEARSRPRGVDEWCKVSPLIVDSGLQFIFNNLLDPQSVELTRKQPTNPAAARGVRLEDPHRPPRGADHPLQRRLPAGATQTKPDTIDALDQPRVHREPRQAGRDTTTPVDPTVCDGTYKAEDGKHWPLKTQHRAQEQQRQARADDHRSTPSTARPTPAASRRRARPPQNGADTCCDACDYELSVNVWKYGVHAGSGLPEVTRRGDEASGSTTAIICDPMGDKFAECADFIPHVYRAQEVRNYEYDWQRRRLHEAFNAARCRTSCARPTPTPAPRRPRAEDGPVQRHADCTSTPRPTCRAWSAWVATARAPPATPATTAPTSAASRSGSSTAGPTPRRPAPTATASTSAGAGRAPPPASTTTSRSTCAARPETCADENDNNKEPLPGRQLAVLASPTPTRRPDRGDRGLPLASAPGPKDAACDPLVQPGPFSVTPIARYDRKDTLPTATRKCVCEDEPVDGCEEFVDSCAAWTATRQADHQGGPRGPVRDQVRQRRNGGVIYDPAVKGVQFLPADLGLMTRSLVEACSAGRPTAPARSTSRTAGAPTTTAPRSSRTSTGDVLELRVQGRVQHRRGRRKDGPIEYIRDKVGNTLRASRVRAAHAGLPRDPGQRLPDRQPAHRRLRRLRDPLLEQVRPQRGEPQEAQIVEISLEDGADGARVVAGGIDCADRPGRRPGVPCLTVNVRDQEIGTVRVSIDTQKYGADVLVSKHRYRLKVPGLPEDLCRRRRDPSKTEIIPSSC
jgi:hypothetical protein